ncbi:MAG: response regulator [Planctomycetota bacterium]|jgi:putative two-component system response regulator|nr:response regulator [Planctomycetota bacterium]
MVRQAQAGIRAQESSRPDWHRLERSAILVVDDDPGVRDTVSRCLQIDGYEVCGAANLGEARQHLESRDIFLVLTDITLEGGESGLDLLDELQAQRSSMPIIMMTANSELTSAVEALKKGAYDYLCKPFPFEAVRAAVRRVVDHLRAVERSTLIEELETRKQAEDESLQQFLVSMATVVDAKSRFTALHGARVSELCRLLGEALGYDSERTELVALGGRLHDIGKIGTPDAILDKPGPLTREEYAVIQEHPAIGDDLIAPIKVLSHLRPMIRSHHESLDGKGYPDAMPGDQVPEEAWVVKVADYWEAITARRPYRNPMPLEKAVACLRGEAGIRIPEDFVEVFLAAIPGAPIALPSGAA